MNSESDSKNTEQPQEFSIVLNVNELNIVLGGLQELPHKISDAVIRKIMEQIQPTKG